MTTESCKLCPRRCGQDRRIHPGRCGETWTPRLGRAALHLWEEPCLSGGAGSGTVFFSGCPLRCVYCQNHEISSGGCGWAVTEDRLGEIFLSLQAAGAANINLVSPTPFAPVIASVLRPLRRSGKLSIPVVYNTGGYERAETVRGIGDVVDIWLADVKYRSPALSARYSDAPDYFDAVREVIPVMAALTGPPVFSDDGGLTRGLMVRHLVLPSHRRDSMAVLSWLSETLPRGSFLLSLMSQYTPAHRATQFPELNRRVTSFEYQSVLRHAESLGLDLGYRQALSSAKAEFTPPFDGSGVLD